MKGMANVLATKYNWNNAAANGLQNCQLNPGDFEGVWGKMVTKPVFIYNDWMLEIIKQKKKELDLLLEKYTADQKSLQTTALSDSFNMEIQLVESREVDAPVSMLSPPVTTPATPASADISMTDLYNGNTVSPSTNFVGEATRNIVRAHNPDLTLNNTADYQRLLMADTVLTDPNVYLNKENLGQSLSPEPVKDIFSKNDEQAASGSGSGSKTVSDKLLCEQEIGKDKTPSHSSSPISASISADKTKIKPKCTVQPNMHEPKKTNILTSTGRIESFQGLEQTNVPSAAETLQICKNIQNTMQKSIDTFAEQIEPNLSVIAENKRVLENDMNETINISSSSSVSSVTEQKVDDGQSKSVNSDTNAPAAPPPTPAAAKLPSAPPPPPPTSSKDSQHDPLEDQDDNDLHDDDELDAYEETKGQRKCEKQRRRREREREKKRLEQMANMANMANSPDMFANSVSTPYRRGGARIDINIRHPYQRDTGFPRACGRPRGISKSVRGARVFHKPTGCCYL